MWLASRANAGSKIVIPAVYMLRPAHVEPECRDDDQSCSAAAEYTSRIVQTGSEARILPARLLWSASLKSDWCGMMAFRPGSLAGLAG